MQQLFISLYKRFSLAAPSPAFKGESSSGSSGAGSGIADTVFSGASCAASDGVSRHISTGLPIIATSSQASSGEGVNESTSEQTGAASSGSSGEGVNISSGIVIFTPAIGRRGGGDSPFRVNIPAADPARLRELKEQNEALQARVSELELKQANGVVLSDEEQALLMIMLED